MGTDYKQLFVWQKSKLLVKFTYVITQQFPQSELYGITNQMRRAAVSVPSNIAEGQMRETPGEYLQFIAIAQGSLAELDTQMHIAHDVDYITQQQLEEFSTLHDEVSKMLASLKIKIKDLKLQTKN